MVDGRANGLAERLYLTGVCTPRTEIGSNVMLAAVAAVLRRFFKLRYLDRSTVTGCKVRAEGHPGYVDIAG